MRLRESVSCEIAGKFTPVKQICVLIQTAKFLASPKDTKTRNCTVMVFMVCNNVVEYNFISVEVVICITLIVHLFVNMVGTILMERRCVLDMCG
jgi:hypothetical protein